VLSALGLAAAPPRRDASRSVLLGGGELTAERLAGARAELLEQAVASLGGAPARIRVTYELRYRGQSFELAVQEDDVDAGQEALAGPGTLADPEALAESFARAHERRYGYRDDSTAVELVNIRASVWGDTPAVTLTGTATQPQRGTTPVVFAGEELEATVLRGAPPAGARVTGPALIALPDSTLLVPPGWSCEIDAHGTARLRSDA
jgi:N-methylhydantoinase A